MATPMSEQLSPQIILQLLNAIENKTAHQQKLCTEYRQLLRPWPRKSKDSSASDGQSKDECVQQPSAETLTVQEKEELALIEKMLNKANKAKDVQTKLKKREENSLETKDEKMNLRMDSSLEKDNKTETENHVIKPKALKSTDDKVKRDNSVTHDKTKPRYAVMQNSVKVQSRTSKTAESANLQTKQNRMAQSRLTENKTAGKRTVSAHVKAPFQTNATISVPKRSSTQQAMASGRRPASARLRPQGGTVPKSTGPQPATSNVMSKGSMKTNKIENNNSQVSGPSSDRDLHKNSVDTNIMCKSVEGDEGADEKISDDVSSQDTETVEEKVENLKISDPVEEMKPQSVPQIVEQPFCLRTDGQSMKLPGKLRKCYATIEGLRKKLYMQRMTKKVDAPHKGQVFMDRLQETFSDEDVHNKLTSVKRLLNSYEHLISLFRSLNLDLLNEESSMYEILRAKKMAEMILVCFSELEEARHLLDPGLNESVKLAQQRPDHTVQLHSEDILSRSVSLWIPHSVHSVLGSIPKFPDTRVQYRSLRELERYHHLVFQTQYQALQCHLVDCYGRKLLPVLHTLDPNSSEYIQMLRSLYSLISDGKLFTVVVKDTIQDLEDSILDTDSEN